MKKVVLRLILILFIAAIPVMNGIALLEISGQIRTGNEEPVTEFQLPDISVDTVEKNINALNEERARKEEELRLNMEKEERYNFFVKSIEEGSTSFRQTFSDTLIIGDSLMNALRSYELLDKPNVIAKVSASLNHLESNLVKIVVNKPEKIITHYGINTLYNCDWFISNYRRIITRLQKELPDTEIYVSGIFNVSPSVADKFPEIAEHNQRLREMCEELGVGFIDNSACLPGDDRYYVEDGIHLTMEFYTEVWLFHIYREIYIN